MTERTARPGQPSHPTRELLLDTAERLFAQRGTHGVALREIGVAAGQRNNGVTQYHFGSKEGLIHAVFERRAAIVDAGRNARLAELSLDDASVASILLCYIAPLGEQVAAGNWYVPFLSRLHGDRDLELLMSASPAVKSAYTRVARQLRRKQLADLPRRVFAARWRIAVNVSIDALADYQLDATGAGNGERLALGEFVADLAHGVAGLLTAPPATPSAR